LTQRKIISLRIPLLALGPSLSSDWHAGAKVVKLALELNDLPQEKILKNHHIQRMILVIMIRRAKNLSLVHLSQVSLSTVTLLRNGSTWQKISCRAILKPRYHTDSLTYVHYKFKSYAGKEKKEKLIKPDF
jgi:hypothetical protein